MHRRRSSRDRGRRRAGRRIVPALAAAAALVLAACGADETPVAAGPEPVPGHVHGLGVDPADGALFIATHSGLFRAAPSRTAPQPVGTSQQDTMGFTVVGPRRFLGSGHPDARTNDPPVLGLIESTDAGRTWQPVSLRGQADFHVLRTAGTRVYGVDAVSGRLLVSDDGGRSWAVHSPPGPVIDLAPDPADPDRLVASTERGPAISVDAGRRWRPLDGPAGLLVWPDARRLVSVDGGGHVWSAARPGARWRRTGDVAGRPAALAAHADELLVALHDGTIKRSVDGGATWSLRARLG